MVRLIGMALVLAAIGGAVQGQAQPPKEVTTDITKTFEIGQLGHYFKLVKAEHIKGDADGFGKKGSPGGSYVQLQLEAIKDVNLAELSFKAGIFDKDRLLTNALTVRFYLIFPLQRGESVRATFVLASYPLEGHIVVIRRVTPTLESGGFSTSPSKGKGVKGGKGN